MALKTRFIRDNRHRIMGTVVSGYQDGSEIVKNKHGQIIAKVYNNEGFMRDGRGAISFLTPDPGLAFAPGFSEDNDE